MAAGAGPTRHRFPDGFLWGAATAAHQVEGGNVNSDGWVLEHLPHTPFREPSGDACDFLHRYPDDVATVAALGLNAFRFGVEWARVEPERGEVSGAALDHYSRVVDACLEHGIAPVVTLHHFTSPRWLIREGGWRSTGTPGRFAEYSGRVMRRLGDRVEWVCTINEANTPLQLAVNGLLSADEADETMSRFLAEAAVAFGPAPEPGLFLTSVDEESIAVVAEAHRRAVDAIHAESARARAGVTLSLQQAVAGPGGEAPAEAFDESVNRRFLRELGSVGDFVGVQNYTRLRFGPGGPLPATENVTGAGLELVPSSLAATCRQAADLTGLPVLVTEHGADLDDEQDHRRAEFIEASLRHLAVTVDDGLDVRGYLHWSLMDNCEWFNGFHGHFGLLGVDRTTQRRLDPPERRRPRPHRSRERGGGGRCRRRGAVTVNEETPLVRAPRGGVVERIVRWAVGVAVRASLLVTPRPAALLVRRVFAMGGARFAKALDEHAPTADMVVLTDERYGDEDDMLLDVVRPASAVGRLPLVLWVHGGGWVGGSKDELRSYFKLIANDGYVVVGPRYSLAPEHHYPTPPRQMMRALEHLQANAERYRIDPDRIAIAGDSAGAQIAAQLGALVTTPGYAEAVGVAPTITPVQLRGVVLACGPYDLGLARHTSSPAGRRFIKAIMWAYSGTRRYLDDARFSTWSVTDRVTSAFPPTLITVGNADPLRPHSELLADNLRALRVELEALFFPADHQPPLGHEYQFDLDTSDGRLFLERLLTFLRQRFGA